MDLDLKLFSRYFSSRCVYRSVLVLHFKFRFHSSTFYTVILLHFCIFRYIDLWNPGGASGK